jgi:basic membrane lipoprotein Med (substrate-binding protein (PBP1-ABC) superfamily)
MVTEMTNTRYLALLSLMISLLLLTACNKDDETVTVDAPKGVATVTFLVTPNGLGDNGYNDAAAEGIFAFANATGTRLRLLLPKDEAEAENMYRQWLTDNATQDSAVMILGSSAYEGFAQSNHATLTGKGSRVLLFESDAVIDGVSTVLVSHYGVSYLAGAMSQGFDALILAATEGVPALEESIAGYQDAREIYAGENNGKPCQTTLHYLADNESGFAMPDSAYRYIVRRADDFFFYDEMVFPLLGGSESGVLRYMNDDEFTLSLMVGMDVDQSGQSSRIPFSVVIRIGDVLRQCLNDWISGREWPGHMQFGMKDGAADIVVTPNFFRHLNLWDNRYADPDTFQRLYEKYKDEAMKKEQTLSLPSL